MNILLVDDERLAVEVMNRMIDKEKYGFSTIYKALSMTGKENNNRISTCIQKPLHKIQPTSTRHLDITDNNINIRLLADLLCLFHA